MTPKDRERMIREEVRRLKSLLTPAEAYRAIALYRLFGPVDDAWNATKDAEEL